MFDCLLIENKGELDINSLILLGASTKRGNDNKIGMFGSGNKYALAVLLRENIPIKIYSGLKEIKVTTKDVTLRDKIFKQIIIDGKETSITIDAGPQWEIWMAIRELVSNAKDEGQDNIVNKTNLIEPKEGFTRFYIKHTSKVLNIIQNWDNYFSWDRIDILESDNTGKIFENKHPEGKMNVYRKGIKCIEEKTTTKSLFHYDFYNLDINESRIVVGNWQIADRMGKMLAKTKNKKIAYEILKKSYNDEYNEYSILWGYEYNDTIKLSETYKEVIGNKIIIVDEYSANYQELINSTENFIVKESLAKVIHNSFPDVKIYGLRNNDSEIVYDIIDRELYQKEKFLLKKVKEFLNEINYPINYDIKIGKFINNDTLGTISDKEIILSEKIFDLGIREIVLNVIEQNEHLISGYRVRTKEFLEHFINMFLKEKEERYGFFI